MLKSTLALGLWATVPRYLYAAAKPAGWHSDVLKYLEKHSRPDGGYAWEDQEESHLTPTWAVVGCYHLLKQSPQEKRKLAEFIRTHHPRELKKLEQEHHEFEFQQIQSLLWLGENASSFAAQVSNWKSPTVYLKQYEQNSCPILRHEVAAFTCRELLGLPLTELSAAYVPYLDSRRRQNGSFNNTGATDGSEGHVLNTWWGLQALQILGRAEENKSTTVGWLQKCQLSNGGFTYQPKPELGGLDDVAYTWAAVRALKLLGSAPKDPAAAIKYLHSLANENGGFADRPGWLSNPVATYYALDALNTLEALGTAVTREQVRRSRPSLPKELKVFSIQIEAHGKGSPAEAVDLARALHIHLWGAKNAEPGWIARAQSLADQQKVPVKFFVSNEEYGTWVKVPGMGTYSHTSDIIAPTDQEIGPSLANTGVVTWPEFREKRLGPLQKGNGRLIWQFGENEELVRMYLDDSVQRGGYAAISTFHFGNPDFTNSEPFLQRWRGQIPYVALQDAHGNEPWWLSDMTTGCRTIFLATEPTWEGWLKALEQNWVVAVRHDVMSKWKTWMHSGSREVLDFVRAREREWKWWDNAEIQRPLVSVVAIKPEDRFEAGRPESGVMLRVRCAWENTAQGLPKKAMTELIKLVVDGAEVKPTLVSRRAPRGAAMADHYHQYHLLSPAAGKHVATAFVREIESQKESSRSVEFLV